MSLFTSLFRRIARAGGQGKDPDAGCQRQTAACRSRSSGLTPGSQPPAPLYQSDAAATRA